MLRDLVLPETNSQPIRLDLPVLRHLTFVEAHSFELGMYFGLLLVSGLALGRAEEVWLLAAAVARKVMTRVKAKDEERNMEHDLGFHDVLMEPVYFGAATTAVVVVSYALGVF